MSHAMRIYNVNALHTCAQTCESANPYRGRTVVGRRWSTDRKVLHLLSAVQHICAHVQGGYINYPRIIVPRATRYMLVKPRK